MWEAQLIIEIGQGITRNVFGMNKDICIIQNCIKT